MGLEVNELTKKQKKMLEFLGKDYRMKIIDFEDCIYRDLGDYDIEISRAGSTKKHLDIYVWRTKGGLEIVEKHFKVNCKLENVKSLLDEIVTRYSIKD